MRTRGDLLSFDIAFVLRGARTLVRAFHQELTEEERYRVADDVVHRLKQHSDGKLVRTCHLNGLLIAAVLIIPIASLNAQDQQQNFEKLKVDARNAVSVIGADKHKTQTYCQILELERQLQADQENHKNKKAKKRNGKKKNKTEALSQKITQLQKQLGAEFFTIDNVLNHVDLKSPDGQKIGLMIQMLNESCPY